MDNVAQAQHNQVPLQNGMASSFSARKHSIGMPGVPSRIDMPSNPLQNKFNSMGGTYGFVSAPSANSQANIGNLLTPPSTLAGDSLSPISAGGQIPSASLNAATSQVEQISLHNTNQYQANGWPAPPSTGLTPLIAPNLQPPATQQIQQSWGSFPPPRNFSPLKASSATSSPSGGFAGGYDSLPALQQMSMPTSMPALNSLSSLSQQQVQVQTSYPAQQINTQQNYMAAQQPQQQVQSYNSPSSQSQPQQTQAPQQQIATQAPQSQFSPISPTDPNYLRQPPTPSSASFFGSQAANTPQSTGFPAYGNNQSNMRFSPISTQQGTYPGSNPVSVSQTPLQNPQFNMPQRYNTFPSIPLLQQPPFPNGMSPASSVSNTQPSLPLPQYAHAPQQSYQPYQMAPMTNAHLGPASHPTPFHSGTAAHMSTLYTSQSVPTTHADRPFKCDACPQSFNRNHDLKRHKRIHLSVKPFPCGYCEKSFSRKDALKRHILVKGCGKSGKKGSVDEKDGVSVKVELRAGERSGTESA